MKNIPQWRIELFKTLAEELFLELSDLTEGELRSLRGELSHFETSHGFEKESSRKGVRAFIRVLGTLLLRF